MEWFKNTFYEEDDPYITINKQVEKSPTGAENLIFLPYLTGERCSHADTDARGAFLDYLRYITKVIWHVR